jgi:hypothetical protein
VDECSTNVGMVPLRAGASKGKREGAQELGEERDAHLLDLFGGDGPFNEHRRAGRRGGLRALLERLLRPSLRPGRVVLMDDLSVQKTKRGRELIEGRC